MSQNQKRARFDLRTFWRRSIRAKLLISVGVAIIVTLIILGARVLPPVQTLVADKLRQEYSQQLQTRRDRIALFVERGRQDIQGLGNLPAIKDFVAAQTMGDTATLTKAREALQTQLIVWLCCQKSYADLRYLDKDGQQIASVTANADGSLGLPLGLNSLISEGDKDYFHVIMAQPEGQAYLFPSSTSQAELEMQIGLPVYAQGSPVGAVIGNFHVHDYLKDTFQLRTGDSLSYLVDQTGAVVVVADPSAQTPVSILGDRGFPSDRQIPSQLLTNVDQDQLPIEGSLYSTIVLKDMKGMASSRWMITVSQSAEIAYASLQGLTASILISFFALAAILFAGIALVSRSITQPLMQVIRVAGRVADGDLKATVSTGGEDEVGRLAVSVNTMSARLSETIGTLESRVAERTRNIEIAAEISRDAAQSRNITELLQRTVDAILSRFNFYHVQFFLLDDARLNAVLVTSTGEAGKQLLGLKHKLAVGSDSIIGQVTAQGRTFITLDTQTSTVPHRFNPLLPQTRSEMALPLRIGDNVIGALDIQSVEPDAFGDSDVQIFQVLADQVAVAIDNARLIAESEQRIQQIADLNRQLTRAAWTEFIAAERPESLSAQYDLTSVTTESEPSPDATISADIKIRGETVGSLSVQEDPASRLSDDDRDILESVAERIALAVENARLIEQSQAAAAKIEQLYEASRTLGSAVDLEAIFRITTDYLSVFETLDRLTVLLARPNPTPEPEYFEYAHTWERTQLPVNPFQERNQLPGDIIPFDHMLVDPRAPRIVDLSVDLADYESARNLFDMMQVRSLLLVPLATVTHWFGVLMCESIHTDAFNQNLVQFASALADQIAVAIDNRRLFENVQAEARRNRALADAAQLSSQIAGDFETGAANLFQTVAEPANYDRWWFGQLTLTDDGLVLQRVTSHFGEGSPLHYMARINLSVDQNALAEATRIGQMVLVNDPMDHFALSGVSHDKARAFGKHVAVPVRVGANLVGTLMTGRALAQPDLDERDVQLAVTLASQIAVVMENRRLFTTAEAERQTLQAVLSSLPTGVIVTDAKTGKISLSNDLARTLLGLNEEEPYLRVHTGTEQPYTDDEFPPNLVLKTSEPAFTEDMTVIGADGDHVDLIVNAAPIKDQDGSLISAVAVFQDVSELRELENVLQESLRETTSLYEVSRTIAAEHELTSILGVVVAQIAGLVPPDYVFAVFRNEHGDIEQSFVALPETGWQVSQAEETCPVPQSILRGEAPLVIEDIAQNPDLAHDPQLNALGLVSVSVFPLNARGRVAGWLVIGQKHREVYSPENQRFMTTLCEQAAVAAENARLAQATAQALSETTLLYDASYEINRATGIEDALEITRDQIKSFAPTQIDIFLIVTQHDESKISWVIHWDARDPATQHQIQIDNVPNIDDYRLIDMPPYFVDDMAALSPDEQESVYHLPAWENNSAQASVPLIAAGRPTGRLVISFNRPYKFGRLERQFVTTLADQAAVVINNNMLVQQTQDSLEETGTLYQCSRAIADAAELSQILGAVLDHAAPPVVSWGILVRLLTPDWNAVGASIEVVGDWARDVQPGLAGSQFMQDQLPAWPELSSADFIWVEDVESDPRLSETSRHFYQEMRLKSLISVPLAVSNRPIGTLMFGADDTWLRTDRDIRIFSSLADQAAISIENRSLLFQAEHRARQLQTSAQIAQAATSILNLNELFDSTVSLIRDSFQYDHVQIFLVNEDNTDAQLVASTGDAGRRLLAIHHHLPVGSQSIIGQVTATGNPQIASDTADPRSVHKPNPLLPDTRSELALPLTAKNVILGALDVQSNRPGAFGDEDERILSSLANQIAIAIDNARLFEVSTQRVEEMRFLFDVTRTASAGASEIEQAIQNITQLMLTRLQAVTTALLLLDDTGTRLVRYSSTLPEFDLKVPDSIDLGSPLVREVIINRRYQIIDAAADNSSWGAALPGAHSVLLVPLLSGEDFVGVLGVMKKERHAFTPDNLQLLQTLSSSLAAVIQNVQLLQQVQAANARLREVDKLKNQFLANMSHELRTPLNSIIGFSRVILKGIDGPLTPTQEQDLSTIHESGKHLLNLVNDILDQAKIEAGKMELSYGYFSVADLIKSVMSTAVGLVKDKPVRLHQEIETDLPQAWGDEFRSRQVLLNLVSNAAKFTEQGSITVSAFRIEDSGYPMIQVSVTDTGIGIPEDKQTSIFEAFQQVENSTARQYEGTGLGLPIAKSLIEMQGGRIWVNSEIGVGSTFSFTLPLSPVAVEEEAEPETEAAPVVNGEIENQVSQAIEQAETPKPVQRIVLAVDDEISIINLYRRHLARSGYEVIGSTPEEAEELAINYQPRVILLDVNMPTRSGWDVLAHLKDRDETFEIPVIVCTVETDRERAFRLGAADFLMKPIDEQQLIDTVKRVELERDRRKVLIIDDQPDSIRLVRDAIAADERFVILEAIGGPQGLDMVSSHWPDLVILDLRMPEMDGFAVLDQLRGNPATANIPVLVVTAGDLSEEEQQCLTRAGVSVYRKQAIDAADLLNSVVAQMTW